MSAGVSAAAIRNAALASQLAEMHRSLSALAAKTLPSLAAAAALADALKSLQAVSLDLCAPTFRSAGDLAESFLIQIHSEFQASSSSTSVSEVVETSLSIQRCIAFIAAFRVEYLNRFASASAVPASASALLPTSAATPTTTAAAAATAATTPGVTTTLIRALAGRILTLFLRHAALLRSPRSTTQSGRLQLAKDLADLTLATSQHLAPIDLSPSVLGATRAFRSLLFADPEKIPGQIPFIEDLGAATTLHLLFNRLPSTAFKAPQERAGLSPQQYGKWLDAQTGPADAVRAVRSALEDGLRRAPGNVYGKDDTAGDKEVEEVRKVVKAMYRVMDG